MADNEESVPPALAGIAANLITVTKAGPDSAVVQTVSQYLKDLSFENPRPFVRQKEQPEPDFNIVVGVHSRKADEGDYMLEYSMRAEARSEEKTVFLAELIYVGCYTFKNIPDDQIEQILHLQLAPVLFPYARQILDDVVQRGGYPPLHIEVTSVDYLELFKAHLERKKRDATRLAQA